MSRFPWDVKIKSLDELQKALQPLRKGGAQVVFTNGCFDLLHVGHLDTLSSARQQGEVLVVGLNSDSSVRILKGPHRPLQSEGERAQILAALSCVDYVVIFSEQTPLQLLAVLRPDVHVKGGDYLACDLPETPLVESWGGRVHIAPVALGRSTTLLEKALGGT
jgi:D-beta-D-heptose 7-phosphate kinase/D-beta-D-heptose 1-phosphate adenosyltransferase